MKNNFQVPIKEKPSQTLSMTEASKILWCRRVKSKNTEQAETLKMRQNKYTHLCTHLES